MKVNTLIVVLLIIVALLQCFIAYKQYNRHNYIYKIEDNMLNIFDKENGTLFLYVINEGGITYKLEKNKLRAIIYKSSIEEALNKIRQQKQK